METIAIYLVVIFGCGFLARLIKLPTLVGYLAAGFILHAPGIEELPIIDAFAELGVTILLFTIGLKLDVRMLFRREVFLTTAVNLLVILGLTTGFLGLLAAIGFGTIAGEGWKTLALLGFALSFSSTVFVVQVLDERSESHSLYGRIAIGILVLQDVVAVGYLTAMRGEPPSLWAFALILLIPGAWIVQKLWNRLGHGELQALFGVTMAFVPGYWLFETVGIKGDFGAMIVGLLLASHPRAAELSRTLFGLRELLLVGFFVSIGLHVTPTFETVALGLILVVLLPIEAALFTFLLAMFGLRRRTSILAGLALANFSEFGLIVISTGVDADLVGEDWLVVISVAVAASFVVSTLVNRRGSRWVARLSAFVPTTAAARAHPDDAPIDLSEARAMVLGLGRVGSSAYRRLVDEYGLEVIGVENDPIKVADLRERGFDVIEADATETDFWERCVGVDGLELLVLAMPFHGSNLIALDRLERRQFDGSVAVVAQYDDEREELLRRGADVAFHIYEGTGVGLADAAAEVAGLQR
ncbi:potassium transporter Kef [Gordonia paraffinivorans]|uniref:Solute/hydrogen antiporter n=2 Tax=Gordonia paraffinivorans TaxID=175628 RepID=A0ABQ0IL28_9ACTN|nr:cation:proton antiporter family protein [Gordonia paraffinivorans]MBY4575957.1 potassium transporter Kef [Gordonia paraffinivorans]GAC84257.1 putative solute/hydrogen antiporter [Gordonia paraffinivorans NBRC 108238]VFA90200.1 K(+)/H(+) antiporter [Gordonia paraffinivorans]